MHVSQCLAKWLGLKHSVVALVSFPTAKLIKLWRGIYKWQHANTHTQISTAQRAAAAAMVFSYAQGLYTNGNQVRHPKYWCREWNASHSIWNASLPLKSINGLRVLLMMAWVEDPWVVLQGKKLSLSLSAIWRRHQNAFQLFHWCGLGRGGDQEDRKGWARICNKRSIRTIVLRLTGGRAGKPWQGPEEEDWSSWELPPTMSLKGHESHKVCSKVAVLRMDPPAFLKLILLSWLSVSEFLRWAPPLIWLASEVATEGMAPASLHGGGGGGGGHGNDYHDWQMQSQRGWDTPHFPEGQVGSHGSELLSGTPAWQGKSSISGHLLCQVFHRSGSNNKSKWFQPVFLPIPFTLPYTKVGTRISCLGQSRPFQWSAGVGHHNSNLELPGHIAILLKGYWKGFCC